ncbi:hypothetical protein VTO73DRAFT_4890 [Trametes versicolor]
MQQLLDLDVLELVCELLDDAATVLSFALVSHALHPVALKRLLRMRPVALVDERSVRAFHDFVVTDAESRLPFVRALEIRVLEVDEQARQDVARRILDLLERVTHLESLTLPHPKYTFRCLADPRIPEAIARIATLRKLGLLGECDEAEAIIKATRSVSSLRVLRVSLVSLPFFGGEIGVPTAAFDAFMSPLAPTLEVLDITERTTLFSERGAQYPALRSLKIGICTDQGMMRTDILVYKFPSLDGTLSLGPMYELTEDVSDHWRIREANKERQQHQSWAHLDRVMGDLLSVFVLGLTCPVRHLMLDVCYTLHLTEHLVDILRTTPPTHLKLTIALCYGPRVRPELFPPEVVPRLTHLALALFYSIPVIEDRVAEGEPIATMQWEDLLTPAPQSKIVEAIRPLRLTHLRVFVQANIADIARGSNTAVPYSKDFVRAISSLNHQQTAKELMDAVPSLQYVFLSVGSRVVAPRSMHNAVKRGRWLAHSAWKNMGRGSCPSGDPKKLDESVMERMLLDENLVLSANDNHMLDLNIDRAYSADEIAPWATPV